jgi:hypothetical protein
MDYYTGANLVEAAVPSYLIYKYTNSLLYAGIVFVPLAFFGMLAAGGALRAGNTFKKGYIHEMNLFSN